LRRIAPKAAKKHEAKQIARAKTWHARRPGFVARSAEYLTTPIVWLLHKAIPANAVETTLHGNLWLARKWARERVTLRALGAADFAELKQAELLHSDRVVRRIHRRAVLMAGGIGFTAGFFGFLGLPLGMAGALNLAMRTIHRIGLCYGYPVTSEAEQLFIYYTLSLAGNRHPAEKEASLLAMRELQALIASLPKLVTHVSLNPAIRDKAFTIAHHDFSRDITKQLVQVRLLTSIPGIGGIIGIIVDTNYMRSVGWAARHAYQLRWLRDRGRLDYLSG
jgi:hypothetical protein